MAELVAVPPLLMPDQADQRYAEAIETAVAACADDTAGQRCYICLEAVDPDTNEGLVRGCACRGGAGFAHVSCLAKQAHVTVQRGDPNGWVRWHKCGLCEQNYYGIVRCALGWACWKTYLGLPEEELRRQAAINLLGLGLLAADHHEDALSVQEANLSMLRRFGAPEKYILSVQTNLACLYSKAGRHEQALQMKRDIYYAYVKLNGEDHGHTLQAASNYAVALGNLGRFEEARSLLRKTVPVARRVLGNNDETTFRISELYALALFNDTGATPADLLEAMTTLEDTERTSRRVLGGEHPFVGKIERTLQESRAWYARAGAGVEATPSTRQD